MDWNDLAMPLTLILSALLGWALRAASIYLRERTHNERLARLCDAMARLAARANDDLLAAPGSVAGAADARAFVAREIVAAVKASYPDTVRAVSGTDAALTQMAEGVVAQNMACARPAGAAAAGCGDAGSVAGPGPGSVVRAMGALALASLVSLSGCDAAGRDEAAAAAAQVHADGQLFCAWQSEAGPMTVAIVQAGIPSMGAYRPAALLATGLTRAAVDAACAAAHADAVPVVPPPPGTPVPSVAVAPPSL